MNSVIYPDRKVRFGATLSTAFFLLVRNFWWFLAFGGLGVLVVAIMMLSLGAAARDGVGLSMLAFPILAVILFYFGEVFCVLLYDSVQNFRTDFYSCLGIAASRLFYLILLSAMFLIVIGAIVFLTAGRLMTLAFLVLTYGSAGAIGAMFVTTFLSSIATVFMTFAGFCCLLERLGPFDSIARAFRLLWGNWSRVVVILFGLTLLSEADQLLRFGFGSSMPGYFLTIFSGALGAFFGAYIMCFLITVFAQLSNYHEEPVDA